LLLDLGQPPVAPEAGLLIHDAPERVHALLTERRDVDRNLQVLCSCSPGQSSLASEELGHTVFAYFVLRGLSGEADGALPNGRKAGRVAVLELVAYVTAKVDRWAWSVRGQRQTPVFYGPNPSIDYTLVFVPESPTKAEAPLEKSLPSSLVSAWQRRDDLRADPR